MCVSFTGCVVTSSQLSSFIGRFDNTEIDLQNLAWRLNIAEHASIVYAVSVPEGILFSNAEGDQILFNGWSVIAVNIMNGKFRSAIDDSRSGQRSFTRGGYLLGAHVCSPWERVADSTQIRLVQDCTNDIRYKNTILLDNNKNIAQIQQIVDFRYTVISLTKLH